MFNPTKTIQSVKFFDDALTCVSHFEQKCCLTRMISLIQSFGTLFLYVLDRMSLCIRGAQTKMNPFTNTDNRTLSKKKLLVCIHGLNNNPTQFEKILNEVQKQNLSDIDIFIPHVHKKGNAKLDKMVQPILKEIINWAKNGDSNDKELILVGVSNGGRISRALETKISQSNDFANIKKLKVISIVGACKGSTLADLANKMYLSCFMSKNIANEMPVSSERNRRLNEEWIEGLNYGPEREYIFIASPHDWQVPNYNSTLMDVKDEDALYAIVPGHGHNSIVNAVAKTVAELILLV